MKYCDKAPREKCDNMKYRDKAPRKMDLQNISYAESSVGVEFWLNLLAFIAQEFGNFSKGNFFYFEASQRSTLLSRPGTKKV